MPQRSLIAQSVRFKFELLMFYGLPPARDAPVFGLF
jgi:hypothetical protein